MNTYESTMSQLRMITRQAQRDGWNNKQRVCGLEGILRQLRKHERKTEPYRQNWLDQIRAYEDHIAELKA